MRPAVPFIRAALAILAASFLLAPLRVDAAPQIGLHSPNFKVVSTSGQIITQENYRGHLLIIDFFATWCLPCRQSIPHLVEMNRKYGKQGLHILGLSVDEDGERAVRAFTEEFRVDYPLGLAGDAATADFGVRSVPVMYVIDKKGNIAEIYRGYSSDKARALETLIKRLLAEK